MKTYKHTNVNTWGGFLITEGENWCQGRNSVVVSTGTTSRQSSLYNEGINLGYNKTHLGLDLSRISMITKLSYLAAQHMPWM